MAKPSFEKNFTRYPLHYFTLLCVLLVALWGILWFNYDPATQLVIVIALGASYVVWGTVHHHHRKDLHLKIFIEYFLLAILGILAFASIVFRT